MKRIYTAAVSMQSVWQSVSAGSREKETVSEINGDELILTPIPLPWCWRETGRESEIKLNSGRRKGCQESVLRLGFISHYTTLI